MRLTAAPQTAVCPPEDVYTLVFTEYEALEPAKNQWSKDDLVHQIKAFLEVIDYPYDPDDDDDEDWNGTRISQFFTFGYSTPGKEGIRYTWNSKRSPFRPVIEALSKKTYEDDESFDLDDLVGNRMKATIKENDKGYPRIESAMALRGKSKAKAKSTDADADLPNFDEDAA